MVFSPIACAVGMPRKLGQVIAISRLVLASVFLLAIYVDPSQPSAAPSETYLILVLYVLVAATLLVVTWRNWWLDDRLARPAHWLDLLVFAIVVYSTEGYTSPFFTFSVFLLLSAAIRWGQSQTTRTAIAVNLVFLLAGLASALQTQGEIDSQRLMIRSTYLAVLSLLFVWYSMRASGGERYVLRTRLRGTSDPSGAIELIVEHVAARIPSAHLICIWRQLPGGAARACCHDEAGHAGIDLGHDELAALLEQLPSTPFLFDSTKHRMLIWRNGAVSPAQCPRLASHFLGRRDLTRGLAIPVSSDILDCLIFAQADVSVDDLESGVQLAEDASFMYEQAVVNRLSEEASADRTRLSVARDLHDSVAQLLAGISFRLEAIKRSGRSAGAVVEDIESLQAELSIEQEQLRTLIAELRRPTEASVGKDVPSRLAALADRLAKQWGVTCTFQHVGEFPVDVQGLANEIQQMVREGVANAVRHGAADKISITLRAKASELELKIIDNGRGLHPDPAGSVRPRSLHERTKALRGSFEAHGGSTGTTIEIRLPRDVPR